MAGEIAIGTSSWADPGFVADWYPRGMAARDRLGWYAERFETVELNSSFYAVPERSTVARWARVTPDDFTFHVKLHRLLSRHAAKVDSLPPDMRDRVEANQRGRVLLDPDLELEMADRMRDAVEPLAEAGKLGAFLLQLTPAFAPGKNELSELDGLIERLAPQPVAVELRNRGWVSDERAPATLGYLSERGAAFVCVDAPDEEHVPIMPALDAVTRDDLAYMRLHGRNAEGYMHGKTVAERFGWRYEDEELEEVAARVRGLAEQAEQTQVMFNNNRSDDAPTAASRFRALIGQDPGPPPDPQLRLT